MKEMLHHTQLLGCKLPLLGVVGCMSSAVAIKVSAELADSARKEAVHADRSLTGQIEHWAKLGRAAEAVLPAQVASALKRCAGDMQTIENESIQSKALNALAALQTQTPGSLRQKIGLDQQTLFEPDPETPGGFIRITPDGKRTRGVMEGRMFVPTDH